MEIELARTLYEYAQERDRNEFALGDTLDVKAGLLLAGLTFLAIQSGDFIKEGLPLCQKVAQYISVLSLVFGVIFSVYQLWPRDYDRESIPKRYEEWIADTDKYREAHPDVAPITIENLTAIRLQRADERITTNLSINRLKSKFMFATFICVAVAFAANVATLIMRLF